jgi:hypothetical protein
MSKAKVVDVNSHLHAFHKAAHADRTMAIANHHAEIKKATGSEEFHKKEIARHEIMLAHHEDGMAECEKAAEVADLAKREHENALVPLNGISGVTPGVRIVPRAGQQPVNKAPEKPNVDLAFEHLFKVDDAEEERSVTKSIG